MSLHLEEPFMPHSPSQRVNGGTRMTRKQNDRREGARRKVGDMTRGELRDMITEVSADVVGSHPRILSLESDVGVLKSDVSVLKSDVSVLKSDVSVLKSDVSVLKSDTCSLSIKMDRLEEVVRQNGVLAEETNRYVRFLAESRMNCSSYQQATEQRLNSLSEHQELDRMRFDKHVADRKIHRI